MNIEHYKLVPPAVKFMESPNTGGTFEKDMPDTIILHYTASPDAKSAIKTLTDPSAGVSAHVVLDRDGSLTQLVPFNTIAWHAGKSSYGGRTGYNKYAIGIEMVNAGKLEKKGDKYVAWFGREYPGSEVVQATAVNEDRPSYWLRYTGEQISAAFDLCADLIVAYRINHILGHSEVSPGRKVDPGPAFPLDEIRNRLLGTASDQKIESANAQSSGIVMGSGLDLHSDPAENKPVIASLDMHNNRFKILDEEDDWCRIEITLKGWVTKNNINKINRGLL